MRFFTLILHALPAHTTAAVVEWCALIVHTHTHTQPLVTTTVCVCVWLKHYRSGPPDCLRAQINTHKHRHDVLSFNQRLYQSLLPIHKTHTETQTQTNKDQITERDLRLLLRTIIPLYYTGLLHLPCGTLQNIVVLLLVSISSARKRDAQW